MFIPARSQRFKAGVMQRLLQSLSNRSLSALDLLQQISALEIRVLRPTRIGTLCVAIIAIVTLLLHNQLVVPIHNLVSASQSTILMLGTLLLWRHLRQAIGEASAQEINRAALVHEVQTLRQALQWQHQLAAIASCVSLEELHRRATSQALAIAGTTKQRPGRSAQLNDAQSTALQMLSTVVSLRSSALEGLAWRDQQRAALDSLWQIAGLLRIPGAAQSNLLHEPFSQLARSLELDWLVLLAPGSHAPIAAVLTVFGRATPGATLSAAQLRVANEALRTEHPLVRPEGPDTLACLPVLRVGHAPMVMVARGAAAEEATQSILLLLGDLLAHHYEQANELGV